MTVKLREIRSGSTAVNGPPRGPLVQFRRARHTTGLLAPKSMRPKPRPAAGTGEAGRPPPAGSPRPPRRSRRWNGELRTAPTPAMGRRSPPQSRLPRTVTRRSRLRPNEPLPKRQVVRPQEGGRPQRGSRLEEQFVDDGRRKCSCAAHLSRARTAPCDTWIRQLERQPHRTRRLLSVEGIGRAKQPRASWPQCCCPRSKITFPFALT